MDQYKYWVRSPWWKLLTSLEGLRGAARYLPLVGKPYPYEGQPFFVDFVVYSALVSGGMYCKQLLADVQKTRDGNDNPSDVAASDNPLSRLKSDTIQFVLSGNFKVKLLILRLETILSKLLRDYGWTNNVELNVAASNNLVLASLSPSMFASAKKGDKLQVSMEIGGVNDFETGAKDELDMRLEESLYQVDYDATITPVEPEIFEAFNSLVEELDELIRCLILPEVYRELRWEPPTFQILGNSTILYVPPDNVDRRQRADESETGQSVGKSDSNETKDRLYRFAASWLKGKQRRLLELVVENDGKCEMDDIVNDAVIDWQIPFENSWNSAKRSINKKLRSAGIASALERHDNAAVLIDVKNVSKMERS